MTIRGRAQQSRIILRPDGVCHPCNVKLLFDVGKESHTWGMEGDPIEGGRSYLAWWE